MMVFSPLEESDICNISLLENRHGELKTLESTKINIDLTNKELYKLVGNQLLARKFNSKRTTNSIAFFEDMDVAFSFKKYIISLIRKDE